MTTALQVYDRSKFLVLSGGGEVAEAMQAMRDAGETFGPNDLIRIKTPTGGVTTWTVPASGGERPEKEIRGALVHWQKCGVLWPNEEMGEGQMPVLRTWDMLVGEQIGPIPDDMAEVLEQYRIDGGNTFHVAPETGFDYAQWGTGKNGIGKRLKEQRMLFVLPEQELAPYLVIAQPGSLKSVTTWFKRIGQLDKVPWWRVVASLKLQKVTSKGGQAYSQIVPETVGILEPATASELRLTWGKTLARVARQVEVQPEETDDE